MFWPETSSQLLFLTHCKLEFDTPVLRDYHSSNNRPYRSVKCVFLQFLAQECSSHFHFLMVILSSSVASPGSPDLMNCPVTVALTLASNRTSAQCVKKSLPAVTTYPNTQRSTVVPGQAGSSDPPCDAALWPNACPASCLLWPGWDLGLPQDLWCFH